MTRVVPIQRGHELRAERHALAKLDRLRELAEELEMVAPEHLDEVCAEYIANGWANEADIRMAKELMG